MRSGIGNSPTDPFYVSQTAATADANGNPIVTPGASAAAPYFTRSVGSSNMATGQVAVTTSATLVCAARAGRAKVTLSSTSAVVFYVGGSGVSAATGLYVAAAAGASVTVDTAAAVYAIGASNVTISFMELY